MARELSAPYPKFAVVGHPNKGKSSIVASLANDDSVQISNTPGTTTKSRSFPLRVDGNIVYELIDTPGFQRARHLLAWLQSQNVPAHKRAQALQSFIQEHKGNPKYSDEIELLTPIMAGAGIIYVVDGSKPYGQEYEAEMEILRWSGQPTMALINRIDSSDYTQEWKRALEQYFRIVREYNPMHVDMASRVSLLEAMAQLDEEWTSSVKSSIVLFEQYFEQKLQKSAKTIAYLVQGSLSYVEKLSIKANEASDTEKKKVLENYQNMHRSFEKESQNMIEQIWNHSNLEKEQERLVFDDMDLFSKESASIFGLSREEMVVTGVTGGAITGAGVDLLLAGHTMLLGGAIGAVVGGVGAYFGFDQISEIKLLGMKLGKKHIEIGPMENRNYPYILLGRSLYHLMIISRRSHAKRGAIEISMDESFKEVWLDSKMRKSLEKLHKKFRSTKEIKSTDIHNYEELLLECINKIIL